MLYNDCGPCDKARKDRTKNPLPGFPADFECRHGHGGEGRPDGPRAPGYLDWMPSGSDDHNATAVYEYTDERGNLLFGVCRNSGKEFRQWRPDPSRQSGRRWSLKDDAGKMVRLVLYRLPEVLAAVAAGETVYVCEGEKDAGALEAHCGVTATCNPMGAGKWRKSYAMMLASASVALVADKDPAGWAHARTVATSLEGVAASVRVVCAKEGKDAADHVAAGLTVEDLVPVDLAAPQPEWARGNGAASSTPRGEPAHLHTPPALASDLDILASMAVQLGVHRGVRGEVRTMKLLYLAITSRVLPDPVNTAVKGLSSSGKSYTVESVVSLFPPEATFIMTAMSERALIYLAEPLAHRTLVLYEAVALQENREQRDGNMASYIVRSLLSEGQIRYPVVVKDPVSGQFTTTVVIVEGPTNLVTSTTSVALHAENETRMLSLPSDDSQAQTRRVLIGATAERKRDDGDLSQWHDLQRWIAQQDTRVVIPFAACAASQIPPVAVRLRRDWNAVRSLIRAHALLHRRNRNTENPDGTGAIYATLADYAAVRDLVNDLIADAIGASVPASVRETVDAVQAVTAAGKEYATVRDVAECLKIERPSASRRLATAAHHGYVTNNQDRRGRPAQYALDGPMPETCAVLPPAEHLCTPGCTPCQESVSAGQACACGGVCRCAGSPRGVEQSPVIPSPYIAPPPVAVASQNGRAASPVTGWGGPCTRCGTTDHVPWLPPPSLCWPCRGIPARP